MTVQERKDRWLTWVKSQVGYHETGSNYTKYAEGSYDEQAYGFSMQGAPWCDFFFDYSFYICFSFAIGNAMIYQTGKYGGAAVSNSMSFYQQAGAFYRTPEVGDQAIYKGANHTGAVVAVYDDGTFDCIDGNYSDAVTFRPKLTLSAVEGFGRPNWSYGLDSEEGPSSDKTDISTEGDSNVTSESNGAGSTKFSKGDVVRVSRGAVCYDNGATLADVVYQHNWIVLSQWNERVIINESEDGSHHIMTPVAAQYLTRVSDTQTDISEPVTTITNPSTESPIYQPEVQNNTIVITPDQVPVSKKPYGIAGEIMEKIKSWSEAHIR